MSYPWYSTPLFMEGFVSFSRETNCETKAVRYVAKAPIKSVYRKHVLARGETLDSCIQAAYDSIHKVHNDYRESARVALLNQILKEDY